MEVPLHGTANQSAWPPLSRHFSARHFFQHDAENHCMDDECVSVEKLRSSPLLSLPPFFLPSPFLLFSRFFQPQQFSGENLWLFVSDFVCTCATSPALGELWFLRWLHPVIAVTQGLSLQRPEEESSATAASTCSCSNTVLMF